MCGHKLFHFISDCQLSFDEKSDVDRSRSTWFENSPNLKTASTRTVAMGTFFSSGGFWPGRVENDSRLFAKKPPFAADRNQKFR